MASILHCALETAFIWRHSKCFEWICTYFYSPGKFDMRFYILFPRTNEQSSVVESFTIYNVVTVLSVPFEFYWLEGAIKIQFVIM